MKFVAVVWEGYEDIVGVYGPFTDEEHRQWYSNEGKRLLGLGYGVSKEELECPDQSPKITKDLNVGVIQGYKPKT